MPGVELEMCSHRRAMWAVDEGAGDPQSPTGNGQDSVCPRPCAQHFSFIVTAALPVCLPPLVMVPGPAEPCDPDTGWTMYSLGHTSRTHHRTHILRWPRQRGIGGRVASSEGGGGGLTWSPRRASLCRLVAPAHRSLSPSH